MLGHNDTIINIIVGHFSYMLYYPKIEIEELYIKIKELYNTKIHSKSKK